MKRKILWNLSFLLWTFIIYFLLSNKAEASYFEIPKFNDIVVEVSVDDITYLSLNAYMEARGESDLAIMMVTATVFNRVNSEEYPSTIKEVILQKHQYSWVTDGKKDIVYEEDSYKRIYLLIQDFIINKNNWLSISNGINHYHTNSIQPSWSNSDRMIKRMVIDNHTFYERRKNGK